MVSIFTKLSILYFSCCLADFLASFVSSALAFLEKTHLGKGEATYLVVSPVSSAIERTRVVFDPGGDPEKACPPQACCLARRCPPAAPLLLSTPPPHQLSAGPPGCAWVQQPQDCGSGTAHTDGPPRPLRRFLPQTHNHASSLAPHPSCVLESRASLSFLECILSDWRQLPLEAGKINTLSTLLRVFPFCWKTD